MELNTISINALQHTCAYYGEIEKLSSFIIFVLLIRDEINVSGSIYTLKIFPRFYVLYIYTIKNRIYLWKNFIGEQSGQYVRHCLVKRYNLNFHRDR